MLRWFKQILAEADSPIWDRIRNRGQSTGATPAIGRMVISDDAMPTFRQRLAEAAAWCSHRQLNEMWSNDLRPSKTRGEDDFSWVTRELVEEVCSRRSRLLDGKASSGLPTGRLLIYAPDENVADGASEMASKGFFDILDTPPWDTWVWFTGKYLVCWVPPQLMRHAREGIDINCVACIEWLPEGWPGK